MMGVGKERMIPKWWFSTAASAITGTMTHPLDLIKVHLQTHTSTEKKNVCVLIVDLIRERGCFALFNGVSATLLCQLTYAPSRFLIFQELIKRYPETNVFIKMGTSVVAGAAAGFVGTPTDVVTVRMQNDTKLPPEQQRHYKHVFHGLITIIREEGCLAVFHGLTGAIGRAIFMTIGQLACYDQIKLILIYSTLFKDDTPCHILTSNIAGMIAGFLAHPMDVVKTRMMNAEKGQYAGFFDCIRVTSQEGILAFYKGLIPSTIRIMINTTMIFFIYEQLRLNFGDMEHQEESTESITEAYSSTYSNTDAPQ